jgi:chemotaxis protein methyltransferase CheR
VGAGTGEGPYSLAIALDEAGQGGRAFTYHVRATGMRDDEFEQARRGQYPLVLVEGLRPDTLRRYFLRGTGLSAGMCRVKDAVRERVSFVPGPASLEALATGGPADLVLLDLSPEAFSVLTRSAVGRDLASHLRPGGLLVVPAWPRGELPIPGFAPVADGVFSRSDSAARVHVA